VIILIRVQSGYLKWYGTFFTVSIAVFIIEINKNLTNSHIVSYYCKQMFSINGGEVRPQTFLAYITGVFHPKK
jgi:hypothetical protein